MDAMILGIAGLVLLTSLLLYLMYLIKGIKADAFELAQNALLVGKSRDLAEAAASKEAFSPVAVEKEEVKEPSIPTADGRSIPISHLERIS